jgi:hypothetical protein
MSSRAIDPGLAGTFGRHCPGRLAEEGSLEPAPTVVPTRILQPLARETAHVEAQPTLDSLVRDWLRARQEVRAERIGSAGWESAAARAEAAGSACLARIIDIEAEVGPTGPVSADDRPISVVIAEAVVHHAPYRSLGK